jgi:hypothetical protein
MKLFKCERAWKHKACRWCGRADQHFHKEKHAEAYCEAARKKLKCVEVKTDG